jgi:hypothetical protein
MPTTVLPCRWLVATALSLAAAGAFAQSAVCSGGSIGLDISVEATPHVHMQLGGRSGNFLIDTGASTSSVDARIFGVMVGSSIRIRGSSFPTVSGGDFAVFDWNHAPAPPGGLAALSAPISSAFVSRNSTTRPDNPILRCLRSAAPHDNSRMTASPPSPRKDTIQPTQRGSDRICSTFL